MSEPSKMPSPFPLGELEKSTAETKKAELTSDESISNTEKVITKAKITDKEVVEFIKSKGYVKKVDLISLPLKEAISDYIGVVISAIVVFIMSAVAEPDANWNFTPFSIMTLLKALLVAVPILANAWRRNGKKEQLPTITETV